MDKVKNKILFVDDEKGLRDTFPLMINGVLRGSGDEERIRNQYGDVVLGNIKRIRESCADVEVITASDGATALEMMRAMKDEILLVVTDMRMPVENGPEINGDQVAASARELDIPVVIISGTVEQDVTAGIRALTRAVFQKPFRRAQVIQMAEIAAQEMERLQAEAGAKEEV